MKKRLTVSGMTCSACASHVEAAVLKLDGVQTATVNLMANTLVVSYDEARVTDENIAAAITAAGYGVGEPDVSDSRTNAKSVDTSSSYVKKRLAISIAFLIPLMMVSMGGMIGLPLPTILRESAVMMALVQLFLTLPILYMNRVYFQKGIPSLWRGHPGMDSLVAIGSLTAVLYGVWALFRMVYGLETQQMDIVSRYHHDLYFESAAMILTLVTLGKFLEERSKRKATQALTALMDLAPKTAEVERNGIAITVPLEQVVVGDVVLVRAGGRVPVDGVLLEGGASVDESALTGESIPVDKEPGDTVISATLVQSGFMCFRATRVGNDTTLSQIVRLVEDAGGQRAPVAKLADKVASIFVPTVMAIALITGIIWLLIGATVENALTSAVCVLIISCPCALGLATPVAITVGCEQGARHGILIKSGEALETAHKVDCVVLDKTGTLTEGAPTVTDIVPLTNDRDRLLRIAAGLESRSEHPLSKAIMAELERLEIPLPQVADFETLAGRGVRAVVDGVLCLAGNERLMREYNIPWPQAKAESLTASGKTPMLFTENGVPVGLIATADQVKRSSCEAVKELRALGIATVMLTGDAARTARAVADEIGIDEVYAEVLPQDKEAVIADLKRKGHTVAMVGDGINDAPALVRADVGMAIGAGSDIAIESADIVLMKSDVRDVVTAIRLSRAVLRNIRQNLFWAFFYNCLGIPLAAGAFYPLLGWRLSPMFGSAAMSFSSVFVVSNALRLRRFGGRIKQQKEKRKMLTITIEGMMCDHCRKRVEDVLNAIEGVTATVDLATKQATVTTASVTKDVLVQAITAAGYTVTNVQ